MDIRGVSTVVSDIKLKVDIGLAVLNKNMDTMKQTGDGIVKMIDAAAMERSVNPNIGGNVDLFI